MTDGTAVVVGATGAIGSDVVRRLRAAEVPVLAVARSAVALADLTAADDGISGVVADLTDNAAVATIADALDGPVRMAVFAAGLSIRGSVVSIDPDLLAVGTDTKVGGVLRLVRAVDERLVAGSRIVCFAGSLGLEPRPTEAGPGTVNAALFNLMRQLGAVYGPRGITTHTVAPGPADTPRLRAIADSIVAETGRAYEDVWADFTANTTLGRLPTADEIAWTVGLLLAPEADVLHGSVLYPDAGGHRGLH
jgi:NAD(P)-dependent dehydrogenase (short-subunit alcohol dehydrogenase family)